MKDAGRPTPLIIGGVISAAEEGHLDGEHSPHDADASMLTAHLFCDEQAKATLGDVARKDWEASEPLVAGAIASEGTSTLSSQGIEGDQAMSLKERAEQGDLEAQYQFGMALKTGAGMPADHVRSRILPVKMQY